MQALSASALAAWLADTERQPPLLLDVREPWEYELCHLEGAQHMPMRTIPTRHEELDRDRDIVTICHHGMRSAQVAAFLSQQGFTRLHNLSGGVAAWAAEVDPAMPKY